MIHGITVTLITQQQTGSDPFGNPVFELVEKEVENVLVAPATTDDLVTDTDLDGKKAVYTLAIPKGNQDNWIDCEVQFFGKRWKSFGFPIEGIEENIPGEWNKKVMVELYG